ncbi:restriction endonuclease subunit S [Dulcicalothrix desertica PCC 7102]|uniref:Restriction endonuclease subunit S n=1 Tax=Dulcicalothrix desertica PCC 7102 TaxID=232991 RepID=A0A433VQT6_9CYAN|nr:restriction endonuclease subunit S [Dulcicalothrix desertica]RUT08457.1 restriction endonuclease subunit S [Dulcicalothrix desertica PCC 7102]TWH40321.1 restriction endonuclease S subunit [Dulcicalothrix desertica PCC 7102]
MVPNKSYQMNINNVSKEGNTRFKKTKIGEIPVGWEVVNYQDISKRLTYGFTNPMPTTDKGPWMVTATNISEGRINYNETRHTCQKAFDELLTDKSRPCIGDVLITKDGTLGRVAIVDVEGICINQSVALIQPDYTRVSSEFLAWSLQSPQMQNRLIEDAGGSTIKHIYITKLATTPVALPPLPEQKKITAVLNSMDEAIAKTQAVTDQTRKVKQGLLQQLLTRGIGHTKFKDSAIGKIPENWNVVELKKLLSKGIQNGYSPICPKEATGHWILSLGAVSPDGFDKSCVKPAPINDLKVFEFTLEPGDFLISRSNTRDRVGFSALFKGEIDNCSYPDLLMRFRVNNNLILNNFLEIYLASSTALEYLQNAAAGTSGSMVKITKSIVEKLQVPIPPLLEQEDICKTIQQIQQVIKHAHQGIERLTITKSGLMQDLLTGHVRVST